ncbi:alanine/glycine:cation symporter family protein [Mangrovivirga sp. M17]|uniref:Alanine/glycine:cation symporter family protein n=1 Tax=Mangrovivirga halotolerans TaxID=2993936 RepID=A0ABT3RWM9_9BACT|nr:alanine/glycine:cation symporter family protein [Mangrovivirga halotolerans]MCX2746025.1 alanine/glycine:cation symporter family protein [Mangrovivirga halotolerans]
MVDFLIEEGFDGWLDNVLAPITDKVNDIVLFSIPLTDSIEIPVVVALLLISAVFFTISFRFINIGMFKHAIDVVRGKYDNPDDEGEVSHFQALTAALSGTVGIGNIGGVAIAVSTGGPGATFWMILAGIFGMTTKFVECTLGVKYRNIYNDGTVSGGPMYYLQKGLAKRNLPRFGRFLAVFFAIACAGAAIGSGGPAQVNQATEQMIAITGGENGFLYGNGWMFGLVMAGIVALVIIGGIKSIVKVTERIVPFMVGIYLLAAFVVLFAHADDIIGAIGTIISEAFTMKAGIGGFVGVMIVGLTRSAYSNEAGLGSASIAHSAVKTDEPLSEGLVALLEPFIDTVVVCTITALVIVVTNNYDPNATEGISLTSKAFGSVITWFPYVLSVAVILFALSTMVAWAYYGLKAWTFLFGENKTADLIYKVLFCVAVVIGSSLSLKAMFSLADALVLLMAFPNLIGLYFLFPDVAKEVRSYKQRLRDGIIKKMK